MYQTTEKQREVAKEFKGGTVHTVIIHDEGTTMRIVKGDGSFETIDVDYDFHPHFDTEEQSPGEHAMDKLRCNEHFLTFKEV